jgi:curved DNA-binding protein CbpA
VIEAAFKRLALKYHPDRSTAPDAADKTRELLAARDVLADPVRRRAYDASIGIVRPPPRPPAMRPEEV